MPNFKKPEDNLSSRLDKWLFFIKNLEDFQSIPSIFSDEIFAKAFEKAELAKFGQEEKDQYESSLKVYRDLYSVIDSAFIEGKTEGRIEGIEEGRQESKRDMAKLLKDNGAQVDLIILSTGFTKEEIDLL